MNLRLRAMAVAIFVVAVATGCSADERVLSENREACKTLAAGQDAVASVIDDPTATPETKGLALSTYLELTRSVGVETDTDLGSALVENYRELNRALEDGSLEQLLAEREAATDSSKIHTACRDVGIELDPSNF